MEYASVEELLASHKEILNTYLSATQIIGRRNNVVVDEGVEQNVQNISKSISLIQKLMNEGWKIEIDDGQSRDWESISFAEDSSVFISDPIINFRVVLDTIELERISGNKVMSLRFIKNDGKVECKFMAYPPYGPNLLVLPKHLEINPSKFDVPQDEITSEFGILFNYRKKLEIYLRAKKLVEKTNQESQVTERKNVAQMDERAVMHMNALSLSISLLERLGQDNWSIITPLELKSLGDVNGYRISYTWRSPNHPDGELIIDNDLIVKKLSLDAITLNDIFSAYSSDLKLDGFYEYGPKDTDQVITYFRAKLPTNEPIMLKAKHLTESTEELQTIELKDGNHAWLNKAAIEEIQTHIASNKDKPTTAPAEEKKHFLFGSFRKSDKSKNKA